MGSGDSAGYLHFILSAIGSQLMVLNKGLGWGQWWWWCLDPVSVLKRFSGCCVEGELRTALVEVSGHLGGHCRSPGELGFER